MGRGGEAKYLERFANYANGSCFLQKWVSHLSVGQYGLNEPFELFVD